MTIVRAASLSHADLMRLGNNVLPAVIDDRGRVDAVAIDDLIWTEDRHSRSEGLNLHAAEELPLGDNAQSPQPLLEPQQ